VGLVLIGSRSLQGDLFLFIRYLKFSLPLSALALIYGVGFNRGQVTTRWPIGIGISLSLRQSSGKDTTDQSEKLGVIEEKNIHLVE